MNHVLFEYSFTFSIESGNIVLFEASDEWILSLLDIGTLWCTDIHVVESVRTVGDTFEFIILG